MFRTSADDDDRDPKFRRAAVKRVNNAQNPPTILVVDDDETNLSLARALLEADGFVVSTAMDAISTFDVLKEIEPVLILMDIQLPGMDGWELTRRLKKNLATSHIPIIAVTAYGQPGDAQRAQEAGFVEFVAKPVSTRELPTIIRKHLSG